MELTVHTYDFLLLKSSEEIVWTAFVVLYVPKLRDQFRKLFLTSWIFFPTPPILIPILCMDIVN